MTTPFTEFQALWRDCGLSMSPTDPQEIFVELEAAYSQENRHYHTFEHVLRGLNIIGYMVLEERSRGSKFIEYDWNVIRWAWWFHDYVQSGDPLDENSSSLAASMAAHRAGLGHQFQMDVRRIVEATSHKRIPLRRDEMIICDVDLSILGAPREEFDRYEAQVRQEWQQVEDVPFRVTRYDILKRFNARPWIYMTEYGRLRWELLARQNLRYSMEKLQAGSSLEEKK